MTEPFNLADNIITQLGLESLPEDRRIAMIGQITTLVEKRVMLLLMENIGEQDVTEANRIADKPEELLAFMAGKVPDIESVIAQETEKIKNELMLGTNEGIEAEG
jgi:hypothetical protein